MRVLTSFAIWVRRLSLRAPQTAPLPTRRILQSFEHTALCGFCGAGFAITVLHAAIIDSRNHTGLRA
jgi:hypothetical protein